MNRPVVMGVIGFVIGGLLTCYFELKSDAPQPARAAEPTAQEGKREADSAVTRADNRRTSKRPTQRANVTPKHKVRPSKRAGARVAGPGNRASKKPGGAPQAARRAKAPITNACPTQPRGLCQVRLDRILVGEDVVANGVLRESTVKEHAKHDKYVVYLELSVTTEGKDGRQRVSHQDFRLEDGEGLIYSPLQPNDGPSADPHVGRTARVGVAFAVYNDSAPARLLYRTGNETFIPLPETIFWGSQD